MKTEKVETSNRNHFLRSRRTLQKKYLDSFSLPSEKLQEKQELSESDFEFQAITLQKHFGKNTEALEN